MKKIFSILFLSIGLASYAQIGIKTDKPKATLDVNGTTAFRRKLVLLNPTDTQLYEGTNDQILTSQGEGKPPMWKSLKIPEYETNMFYLIYNNSFSDKTGVRFTASENSTISSRSATFTKDKAFSQMNGFKKIPGLSQTINVYSAVSKTYFMFETVVQANFANVGNTDTSIDYACGIFVDDKLVNLRQGNLKAINSDNPFLTHNQIGIMPNLSKGAHTVSVACSRLKSYNTANNAELSIGIQTSTSTNIDAFIAQSSLKVDVYEVPEKFNTIFN
ncbi:hypothetical protein [Chryseobacterium sp. MMS23-Vi53]|uniref:hypothetical protein n=1 Tax=Chryseobacterium sp. MMS23-Vi53 TaxID=3386644 RepID=UPI0039E9BEC2